MKTLTIPLSSRLLFFLSALIGFFIPFLIGLALSIMPYYESVARILLLIDYAGLFLTWVAALLFILGIVAWMRKA